MRCDYCRLVFVPAYDHVSEQEELAEYQLHENHDTPGYRRFLARACDVVEGRVRPPAIGLDFGCGPGPVLSRMLGEAGYLMQVYDKFFAPDSAVLSQVYDFVTATEVVEHLRYPAREFECLFSLVKPGGYLVIMTKLVIDREAFSRWHYKNDKTHVCFYDRDCLRWLGRQYRSRVEFIGNDVIVFQKAD